MPDEHEEESRHESREQGWDEPRRNWRRKKSLLGIKKTQRKSQSKCFCSISSTLMYFCITATQCTDFSPAILTDSDQLHPLHALCADGHHGEANGRSNNAVSPGDGQFEEGGDELPDSWPCDPNMHIYMKLMLAACRSWSVIKILICSFCRIFLIISFWLKYSLFRQIVFLVLNAVSQEGFLLLVLYIFYQLRFVTVATKYFLYNQEHLIRCLASKAQIIPELWPPNLCGVETIALWMQSATKEERGGES